MRPCTRSRRRRCGRVLFGSEWLQSVVRALCHCCWRLWGQGLRMHTLLASVVCEVLLSENGGC